METTQVENPENTVINISVKCLIKDLTLQVSNETDIDNLITSLKEKLLNLINLAKADNEFIDNPKLINLNLGSFINQIHINTLPIADNV
jgi:hypothetical protein